MTADCDLCVVQSCHATTIIGFKGTPGSSHLDLTGQEEDKSIKFIEKLTSASRTNHSLLCVGLDPDPSLMPNIDILEFNRQIIEATSDLVCAYKPNLAFYEAMGVKGLNALEKTVAAVPAHIPTIGDAKRADIGNTSRMYAQALFDGLGFDAITVNPYLGLDSMQPFLDYPEKGVFILCRTSNPGSRDFQSLECSIGGGTLPLYLMVAMKALAWNKAGNIGLVVGATHPDELRNVRATCPEMPLLIPGIGAQGGDLEATVKHGVDVSGEKAIIVSSRQIIYASRTADFARHARDAAVELRNQINHTLSQRANK
jgi:orotidine-5'-phosphate decarboxylase